jgi:hypothetical protein
LRETLSKNARAVAEKMTWEATIPQWSKLIDEVVAGTSSNTNSVIDGIGIKI